MTPHLRFSRATDGGLGLLTDKFPVYTHLHKNFISIVSAGIYLKIELDHISTQKNKTNGPLSSEQYFVACATDTNRK